MNRLCYLLYYIVLPGILLTGILVPPVLASQTEPLPDTPAAGYHPGLFTKNNDALPIPQALATVEEQDGGQRNMTRIVTYAIIPGNATTNQQPSVAGYLTGMQSDTWVNISGRADHAAPWQHLTTIKPAIQGIFVWQIPEWATHLTEFLVEIAE